MQHKSSSKTWLAPRVTCHIGSGESEGDDPCQGALVLAIFSHHISQLMALITLMAENLICVMQLVLKEDRADSQKPLHHRGDMFYWKETGKSRLLWLTTSQMRTQAESVSIFLGLKTSFWVAGRLSLRTTALTDIIPLPCWLTLPSQVNMCGQGCLLLPPGEVILGIKEELDNWGFFSF